MDIFPDTCTQRRIILVDMQCIVHDRPFIHIQWIYFLVKGSKRSELFYRLITFTHLHYQALLLFTGRFPLQSVCPREKSVAQARQES